MRDIQAGPGRKFFTFYDLKLHAESQFLGAKSDSCEGSQSPTKVGL